MSIYLGIDTSNYTTSCALYDDEKDVIIGKKKLLPVKKEQIGLRQSEALFEHIKSLPDLLNELFCDFNGEIKAVCVSKRPRSKEDSYMPVFLAGDLAASAVSSALKIKKYECSHQEGHIVAALYSTKRLDLLNEDFYAFHVSGGTTECLHVLKNDRLFNVEIIAKTLDLNAGQLIDRVGVMLGLQFPCGKELEKLALQCKEKIKVHTSFKDLDCNISGAQNQCQKLILSKSKEYVARYAIEYINAVIDNMTQKVIDKYGKKPLIYAGGVMSDVIIREHIENKYGGYFAAPDFSCDNAMGVAIIASVLDKK